MYMAQEDDKLPKKRPVKKTRRSPVAKKKTTKSKEELKNEEYKKQFDALWDTVRQFGGSLGNHPLLINSRAAEIAEENNTLNAAGAVQANDDDIAAATLDVENRMKVCFMLGARITRGSVH